MSGSVAGQDFPLDREQVSIGRNADNVIVISDSAVSGHHCAVLRDGDSYVLRDLDSTNGTRLNGRDVRESPLNLRDLITVGEVEFMFNAEEGEVVETPRPPAAEIEVAPGAAAAPESFDSISPFGARKSEDAKGLWYFIIILIGILALIAVGFLFYSLVTNV
jgi:pSer/pThr/pTyr-binding forkhead associated (FHA) protein